MTGERLRIPGLSSDESDLVNKHLESLRKHEKRNYLRASYYDGKRAVKQIGSIIPPQYARLGIVLGWSAKAVDVLARRCNLDDFVWADGDLESLGARELWDDNHFGAEINSGIVSSLIYGPAFLINTAGESDEPTSLIHVRDARTATGDWNPRRRSMDNLLSVTAYDDDGKPIALTLYVDGVNVIAEKDGSKWSVDRVEHDYGVPVEALVYKPRVGRPFGSSRISRPVMSLHDQALRTVVRMEGHMDVYSYPEMWMLGADESIFKDKNGVPTPQWQVMLGRIKGIPDDEEAENPRADVKQFPAQSPAPHLEALKQQAQLFSGETSIPLSSLGVSDMSNPTSADSYIASREDLIAEAEGATDDWSTPLRRSFVRGLAIANGEPVRDEWKSIEPKWRSPLYLSRAAAADAGSKQVSAVPWLADTSVGLELIGLDDQQVRRALAEKRRADGARVLDRLLAPNPPTPLPDPSLTPNGTTPEADNGGIGG